MASALLGMDPAELPVAQLVRLTGLFGISENRARVALSRMVSAGEATTDGCGPLSAGRAISWRARCGSRAAAPGSTDPYDGNWVVVVVTTSGSTAEVRGARRRSPLLRPPGRATRRGVDAAGQRRGRLARAPWTPTSSAWWRGPPIRTGWSSGCGMSPPGRPGRKPSSLRSMRWRRKDPTALAPGFELSAAVLRHLQADPLLPAELLPERVARRPPAHHLRRMGHPLPGHAERVEPRRLMAEGERAARFGAVIA